MVKTRDFDRGDIVWVSFSPSAGHEPQGEGRPALVLSVSAFNRIGTALVAPITQSGSFARYAGFCVPVSCKQGEIQGVILVNQIRMLDLEARQAKKIAVATDEAVQDALMRLQAIVD